MQSSPYDFGNIPGKRNWQPWNLNSLRIDNLPSPIYIKSLREPVDEDEYPIDPRELVEILQNPESASASFSNQQDPSRFTQTIAENWSKMNQIIAETGGQSLFSSNHQGPSRFTQTNTENWSTINQSYAEIGQPNFKGAAEDRPSSYSSPDVVVELVKKINSEQPIRNDSSSYRINEGFPITQTISLGNRRKTKSPIDNRIHQDLNRVDSTANMDVKKYTRSLIFPLIRRTTINEKRANKTLPKEEMKFLLPSLSFSGARIVRKLTTVPLIDHNMRIQNALRRTGPNAVKEGRFSQLKETRSRQTITLDQAYRQKPFNPPISSTFFNNSRKRAHSNSPETSSAKRKRWNSGEHLEDDDQPSSDFQSWKNEAYRNFVENNSGYNTELIPKWIIRRNSIAFEKNEFNKAYLRMNRALLKQIGEISNKVHAKIQGAGTGLNRVASEFFEPLLREIGLLDRKELDKYQRNRAEIRKNLREKDKSKKKSSKLRIRDWMDRLLDKIDLIEVRKLRKMSPQEIEKEIEERAGISGWEQLMWPIIYTCLSQEFPILDPLTEHIPAEKIPLHKSL